jgi:hypothetical protein
MARGGDVLDGQLTNGVVHPDPLVDDPFDLTRRLERLLNIVSRRNLHTDQGPGTELGNLGGRDQRPRQLHYLELRDDGEENRLPHPHELWNSLLGLRGEAPHDRVVQQIDP